MVVEEFISMLDGLKSTDPDEIVVDFGDAKDPDLCNIINVRRENNKIIIELESEIDDNGCGYVLSDKMLFAMSLYETDVVDWCNNEMEAFNDKYVKTAWSLFKNRAHKAGYYVKDDSEKVDITEDTPKLESIFKQALIDAKLSADRSDIAYEIFTNHLEESGYIKEE